MLLNYWGKKFFPSYNISCHSDSDLSLINDDSKSPTGHRFRSTTTTTIFENASFDPKVLPIYPEVSNNNIKYIIITQNNLINIQDGHVIRKYSIVSWISLWLIPVNKIAEKTVCRSVFSTTWHCILSAELTKNTFLRTVFLAILPTGIFIAKI